jgi:fatty-acyl-CoA synthase
MTRRAPVGTVSRISPAEQGLDAAAQVAFVMRQGRKLFGVELGSSTKAASCSRATARRPASCRFEGPGSARRTSVTRRQRAHGRRLVPDRRHGRAHPDGSMQITDRKKDLIKSGGEWISSIDLEEAAARTRRSRSRR